MRTSTHFAVAGGLLLALILPSACFSQARTDAARPSPPRTLPPRAASAPFHIETWAYDDGSGEGSKAPPQLVARYVTYAESGGDDKVLTDCHTVAPRCKAIHYLNASRIYLDDDKVRIVPVAQETWWLHVPGYTDSAHRLAPSLREHVANLLNQSTPAVQAYYQRYARTTYDAYDGLMLDDSGASVAAIVAGSGYKTSREITTDEQVIAMHQALAAKLTHRDGRPFSIAQNTVNPNPYLPHGVEMIGDPPNVIGLVSEGAPLSNGDVNRWYAGLLDVMARVQKRPGFIVLLSYGSGGVPKERYFHTATIWLGYEPGHLVDWEDLADTTDLAVWPEETIYPMQPLQSMTKSNADLSVSGNVWRREFASCYLKGKYWGRCAALVNFTPSPVSIAPSWLTQPYTNTIQVVGGTMQDPNAAVTLAPLQSSIPANGAILLYGK